MQIFCYIFCSAIICMCNCQLPACQLASGAFRNWAGAKEDAEDSKVNSKAGKESGVYSLGSRERVLKIELFYKGYYLPTNFSSNLAQSANGDQEVLGTNQYDPSIEQYSALNI